MRVRAGDCTSLCFSSVFGDWKRCTVAKRQQDAILAQITEFGLMFFSTASIVLTVAALLRHDWAVACVLLAALLGLMWTSITVLVAHAPRPGRPPAGQAVRCRVAERSFTRAS